MTVSGHAEKIPFVMHGVEFLICSTQLNSVNRAQSVCVFYHTLFIYLFIYLFITVFLQ